MGNLDKIEIHFSQKKKKEKGKMDGWREGKEGRKENYI